MGGEGDYGVGLKLLCGLLSLSGGWVVVHQNPPPPSSLVNRVSAEHTSQPPVIRCGHVVKFTCGKDICPSGGPLFKHQTLVLHVLLPSHRDPDVAGIFA